MLNRSAAIKPRNEQCNQCGTWVSAAEIQKFDLRRPGGEIKCVECVGVYEAAYRAYQQGVTATYLPNIGKATMRCQGWCKRTLEEIWRIDRTHSMFVHYADGEQLMMCDRCSTRFSQSQMNGLYKGTLFEKVAQGIFTPYQRFKKAFEKAAQQGRRMFGR